MNGPDDLDVATTCIYLGSVYEDLGDFEQAKEFYHRALDLNLRSSDQSMSMLQLLTVTWVLFTKS